MTSKGDDRFEPRLGRIRSGGSGKRARSLMSRMAASVSRAGPRQRSSSPARSRQGAFSGGRRVVVKARIIRMAVSSKAALRTHLDYIRRDSAMQEKEQGQLFDRNEDDIAIEKFADDASDDRYHFRLIVSPEDANEMTNMKGFVRDMMANMETDLDTRLDWAAAIHHDTGHTHAHVVLRGKRDNGQDLVIPRAYMSHGMRECAEALVTMELGPETRLEQDRKLAREAQAHRLTRIDRHLLKQASKDHIIALSDSPARYRQLHSARLRTLQRMELAEKAGRGKWKLNPRLETTLKQLSERGDIIKTMNKALQGRSGRRFDSSAIFDKGDPDTRSVTGAIIRRGITGEAHDTAYAIIDALDGRAIYAELGEADGLSDLKQGAIVTLSAPSISPRPSDQLINQIAASNGGVYSPDLHRNHDPKARTDFIAAHVRRLEALRRAKLVARNPDASWTIPSDYLSKASAYERRQARRGPVNYSVQSYSGLKDQVRAMGATWLDKAESVPGAAFGFGLDVKEAAEMRKAYLVKIGVLKSKSQQLTPSGLAKLQERDLAAAGASLEAGVGKPFTPAKKSGLVEGVYRNAIDRPSGRFAVIERAHNFTIVPWRQVLERNRGLAVSGQMRAGRVTWALGKKRGLGIG